jgi:hypothetical protein
MDPVKNGVALTFNIATIEGILQIYLHSFEKDKF